VTYASILFCPWLCGLLVRPRGILVIKNQRCLACMSVLLIMAVSLACSLVSLPDNSSALEPVSVKNAGTVIVLSEGGGSHR